MSTTLSPGVTITASFEAASLQTLLNDAAIQRHANYGTVVSVVSLSQHLKTIENEMQYFRLTSASGLAASTVAFIKSDLKRTARVTKYVQRLLDAELERLKYSKTSTKKDQEMIDGLTNAWKTDASSDVRQRV